MKELETQLRSWALRRPSARLKRWLFASVPAQPPTPISWSWLAPATAALLVMCAVFNDRNSAAFFQPGKSGPLVAMILSNQSSGTLLADRFESDQNNLPADSFDWMNRGSATTGVSYLSPQTR